MSAIYIAEQLEQISNTLNPEIFNWCTAKVYKCIVGVWSIQVENYMKKQ